MRSESSTFDSSVEVWSGWGVAIKSEDKGVGNVAEASGGESARSVS